MKEIKDESYNYTEIAMAIMDEFKESIRPILEEYKDEVSIPDLKFLLDLTLHSEVCVLDLRKGINYRKEKRLSVDK